MKAEARFRPLRFPLGREQAQISSRPRPNSGVRPVPREKWLSVVLAQQSTRVPGHIDLIRLEAGEVDHLPPLLFGDELTEFGRRTGRELTSELGHARCHSGKAGQLSWRCPRARRPDSEA